MSVQLSPRFPYASLSTYGRRKNSLGQGVFSKVYHYQKGSQHYALKRIRLDEDNGGDRIDGREIPQFLLREVTAMVWLQHPNVIRLLDIVIDRHTCYLVMPLANGTLIDLIRRSPTLEERKNYAYQMARGLAYCMENSVWNRDLKPANVLYFREGTEIRLVLTDFGLAKTNLAGVTPEYFTDEVYSLWYRAPELLMRMDYTETTEIWAFGCVLAELYLGRPMCHAGSRMGQLLEIFQMFGTPTHATWPDLIPIEGTTTGSDLPEFQTWDLPPYPGNAQVWMSQLDPGCRELLEHILVVNPAKRWRISQILGHEYFSSVASTIETRFPELPPDPRPSLSPQSFDKIITLRKNEFFGHLATEIVTAREGSPYYQSYRIYFLTLHLFHLVAGLLNVTEGSVELIGLACFDLSQKFIVTEWIYYENVMELTSTPYQKEDLVRVELDILKHLYWDLNHKTAFDHLRSLDIEPDLRPLVIGLLFYASSTNLVESEIDQITQECLNLAQAFLTQVPVRSIPLWLTSTEALTVTTSITFGEIFRRIAKISIDEFIESISPETTGSTFSTTLEHPSNQVSAHTDSRTNPENAKKTEQPKPEETQESVDLTGMVKGTPDKPDHR